MKLSNRHDATLKAVFAKPTLKNLSWFDMEKLLLALGADVINKGGSVIAFRLNGVRELFHRPHPQKEAKAYMVERMRQFLLKAGIKP